MNERIRQLAQEAGMYVGRVPRRANWMSGEECEAAYKKFAELIVRECADIAAKNQAENMNWDIAEIIKEHFGVNE